VSNSDFVDFFAKTTYRSEAFIAIALPLILAHQGSLLNSD